MHGSRSPVSVQGIHAAALRHCRCRCWFFETINLGSLQHVNLYPFSIASVIDYHVELDALTGLTLNSRIRGVAGPDSAAAAAELLLTCCCCPDVHATEAFLSA